MEVLVEEPLLRVVRDGEPRDEFREPLIVYEGGRAATDNPVPVTAPDAACASELPAPHGDEPVLRRPAAEPVALTRWGVEWDLDLPSGRIHIVELKPGMRPSDLPPLRRSNDTDTASLGFWQRVRRWLTA